jgi:hypothetical protein
MAYTDGLITSVDEEEAFKACRGRDIKSVGSWVIGNQGCTTLWGPDKPAAIRPNTPAGG